MFDSVAVFDLDGTLLNTLEDLYLSTNAALVRHGLPTRTREEVRSFVGDGVEMLIRRAVPDGSDEATVSRVLADFKTIYARDCMEHTAPYPAIPALLAALRERGVRVAVVSNKFDAAVKSLCAHYFEDAVEVAVGERADVRKKPAPDTVFEALRALGTSAEHAVYIGDSDTDILTARNAGMDCISVTWGFRDEEFLLAHGASRLARTPEELLNHIMN